MAQAIFYDGQSAWGRSVVVRLGDDTIEITEGEDGSVLASWPFKDLLAAGGTHDGWDLRLRANGHPGRLAVHGQAFVAALRQNVPSLMHEGSFDPHPFRFVLALSMIVLGAVGSLFFIVIPLMSGGLSHLVPDTWEREVGTRVHDAMIASFAEQLETTSDKLRCTGIEGDRAMRRMVKRLAKRMDLPHTVDVTVIDVDNVNAFALPGGRVIVARGLFNYARSGDEVAAVIAHEMVHVKARHPSRNVIEGGATALLLNVFVGGFGQRPLEFFVGNMLISARHSRHRELEADAGAVKAMADAGLDPAALATFLERIARNATGSTHAVSWLLTHPVSAKRAEKVRALIPEGGFDAYGAEPKEPGISWADLTHLRAMCSQNQAGSGQPILNVPKDRRI